jgi:hypothetical protein
MIRVGSLEEIPQPARDRIKAKVMRRFLRHLEDRPDITDDTLRFALGFDRETLRGMYADLSARHAAQQPVAGPVTAALVAAQQPMQTSFAHPANEAAPTAQTGGCCASAMRRD